MSYSDWLDNFEYFGILEDLKIRKKTYPFSPIFE